LFFEQAKLLIDRNQEEKAQNEILADSDKKVLQEVIDHAIFCNETVEKFQGRVDILDQMRDYLLSTSNKPFVIWGRSGCGKTAIMAKVTKEVFNYVPDPQNYSVVLRFLGTTPTSSSISSTLNSIIYQICRLFSLPMPKKQTAITSELKFMLLELLLLLKDTHPSKKVVIMLDSVDQLSTGGYNLDWVLPEFPSNTKMIYSTLPEHGNILPVFQQMIENPSHIIEISALDKPLSKTILFDFLKKENRALSAKQWDVIDLMFDKANLFPLYVTLIFDIVIKWTSSYEPTQKFSSCVTIDKCIQYLFQFFEKVHGKVLFARTIIYMSIFKNGISENEIEDILSLDDDVLYDVFEFHAPPIRKIPLALWSRIKYDLKDYLVEKEVHNTRVIYWYDFEKKFLFANFIQFFGKIFFLKVSQKIH
jgi:hypothetical protein